MAYGRTGTGRRSGFAPSPRGWLGSPRADRAPAGILGAAVTCRLPAAEIEAAVVDQLRGMLRTPEIIVATWCVTRSQQDGLTEAEVRDSLVSLDPVWDELFPGEQARVVQLLVERVEVHPDGLDLKLRVDGLQTLVADLRAGQPERRAA